MATDHMSAEARRLIDAMNRDKIQTILEAFGFAVYASEPLESLKQALKINVSDGTIPFESLTAED